MSADNYWLITAHPAGGFAVVMGFASDDHAPIVNPERHRAYDTIREIQDFIEEQEREGNWTEYGTRLDSVAFLAHLDEASS